MKTAQCDSNLMYVHIFIFTIFTVLKSVSNTIQAWCKSGDSVRLMSPNSVGAGIQVIQVQKKGNVIWNGESGRERHLSPRLQDEDKPRAVCGFAKNQTPSSFPLFPVPSFHFSLRVSRWDRIFLDADPVQLSKDAGQPRQTPYYVTSTSQPTTDSSTDDKQRRHSLTHMLNVANELRLCAKKTVVRANRAHGLLTAHLSRHPCWVGPCGGQAIPWQNTFLFAGGAMAFLQGRPYTRFDSEWLRREHPQHVPGARAVEHFFEGCEGWGTLPGLPQLDVVFSVQTQTGSRWKKTVRNA